MLLTNTIADNMSMIKPLLPLLRLLSDGKSHSGEEIGATLGLSRAAVWKMVQQARALAIGIAAVRGKGYRLLNPIELLDKEVILQGLTAQVKSNLDKVHIFACLDSTNSYLLQAIKNGPPAENSDLFLQNNPQLLEFPCKTGGALEGESRFSPVSASASSPRALRHSREACSPPVRAGMAGPSAQVCLAEYQTAGRGRRGRQWYSGIGQNIALSMSYCFDCAPSRLAALSLASAIACLRALQSLGVCDAQLKWPNDVLLAGKKIGGILIEMVACLHDCCQVVIGVGMNRVLSAQEQQHIGRACSSLAEQGYAHIGRNDLVAALINELYSMLVCFQNEGIKPFLAVWRRYDAWLGQEVVLQQGKRFYEGVYSGIDSTGNLLLSCQEEVSSYCSGEVSLRLSKEK